MNELVNGIGVPGYSGTMCRCLVKGDFEDFKLNEPLYYGMQLIFAKSKLSQILFFYYGISNTQSSLNIVEVSTF